MLASPLRSGEDGITPTCSSVVKDGDRLWQKTLLVSLPTIPGVRTDLDCNLIERHALIRAEPLPCENACIHDLFHHSSALLDTGVIGFRFPVIARSWGFKSPAPTGLQFRDSQSLAGKFLALKSDLRSGR